MKKKRFEHPGGTGAYQSRGGYGTDGTGRCLSVRVWRNMRTVRHTHPSYQKGKLGVGNPRFWPQNRRIFSAYCTCVTTAFFIGNGVHFLILSTAKNARRLEEARDAIEYSVNLGLIAPGMYWHNCIGN